MHKFDIVLFLGFYFLKCYLVGSCKLRSMIDKKIKFLPPGLSFSLYVLFLHLHYDFSQNFKLIFDYFKTNFTEVRTKCINVRLDELFFLTRTRLFEESFKMKTAFLGYNSTETWTRPFRKGNGISYWFYPYRYVTDNTMSLVKFIPNNNFSGN